MKGGTNLFINNSGHMTNMSAMPIYGKNPLKLFPETAEFIAMNLGI